MSTRCRFPKAATGAAGGHGVRPAQKEGEPDATNSATATYLTESAAAAASCSASRPGTRRLRRGRPRPPLLALPQCSLVPSSISRLLRHWLTSPACHVRPLRFPVRSFCVRNSYNSGTSCSLLPWDSVYKLGCMPGCGRLRATIAARKVRRRLGRNLDRGDDLVLCALRRKRTAGPGCHGNGRARGAVSDRALLGQARVHRLRRAQTRGRDAAHGADDIALMIGLRVLNGTAECWSARSHGRP